MLNSLKIYKKILNRNSKDNLILKNEIEKKIKQKKKKISLLKGEIRKKKP
jgi:hypothetical protein